MKYITNSTWVILHKKHVHVNKSLRSTVCWVWSFVQYDTKSFVKNPLHAAASLGCGCGYSCKKKQQLACTVSRSLLWQLCQEIMIINLSPRPQLGFLVGGHSSLFLAAFLNVKRSRPCIKSVPTHMWKLSRKVEFISGFFLFLVSEPPVDLIAQK